MPLDSGRAWPLPSLLKLPLNTIMLGAVYFQGTCEVSLWEGPGQDEVDLNCCPEEFGDSHTGLWAAMSQGCWEKAKVRNWVKQEDARRQWGRKWEMLLVNPAREVLAAGAMGRTPSMESDMREFGIWFHHSSTIWLNFSASVSLSVKWAHTRYLGQGLPRRTLLWTC